jgi:hypothetical protein
LRRIWGRISREYVTCCQGKVIGDGRLYSWKAMSVRSRF